MDIMVGVKGLMLSDGALAFVDADAYEAVSGLRWHRHTCGYVRAWHKGRGRFVYLHRLVTGADRSQVVDHVDHNRLDNRSSNLRLVCRSENAMNRRRTIREEFSSKYRGVAVHRPGRWIVQYKKTYIGIFDDEVAGARAYDAAARADRGVLAQCNFPEESEQ